MYYLTFNSTVFAAAIGVLKFAATTWWENLMPTLIFVVGAMTSLVGGRAIVRGHEYYRRTVYKKTVLEDLLGLNKPVTDHPLAPTLAIASTRGQAEHSHILYNSQEYITGKLKRGSVVHATVVLLWALAVFDVVGAVVAASRTVLLVLQRWPLAWHIPWPHS